MRNIFIIHGSYGHSQENWFPWLKKELEILGHSIFVPDFPVPKNRGEGHKLNRWLDTFEEYRKYVNKDTIIIAHSRGCTFAYHLLPFLDLKINSLFLVGAFADYDQWRPEIYTEYDTFQATPYLWKRIRKLSEFIEVIQSTDDVIPICEGQFVAHWLHAEFTLVKNAKHFNVAENTSYDRFPLLLEHIKNRL